MKKSIAVRLIERITKVPGGCWIYNGSVDSGGYGQIWMDGRHTLVHRLMKAWAGSNVVGKDVCHTCDTPRCCNPDHLRVWDAAANMKDASRKRRLRRGEAHPFTKMTMRQVVMARIGRGLGIRVDHLAGLYGVHPATMSRTLRKERWS